MSAVSKKLMPASMAASTTWAARPPSMRQPKLLQPRPARETSSDPIFRFSKCFLRGIDAPSTAGDVGECYPEVLTPSVLSRTALLYLAATLAAAQPAASPVLLDAMAQELHRNFQAMKDKADPPPYFMSYEVTEIQYGAISATLGSLSSSTGGKSRALDVSVRVGSPKLDNYR